MRPIDYALKKEMESDGYYRRSCLSGKPAQPRDRIVWHHCWIYAGKQINEKWAIMPLLESEHSAYSEYQSVHNFRELREFVQYLSLQRATHDDLKKYSRANWMQIMLQLNKYKDYKYERKGHPSSVQKQKQTGGFF